MEEEYITITAHVRGTTARIRQLHERWHLFPNLTTGLEGYYDPVSQLVVLAALERNDITVAREDRGSDQARRFQTLAAHELTHWLDQVSTRWGRRRLVEAFDAIAAVRLGREEEMWRAVSYVESARRDHLSTYYTTSLREKADAQADKPWRTQMSCGFEFGADGRTRTDRPILFTQFHGFRGPQISRVPFSISSLLEANATWSEIEASMIWAATLDEDRRPVDNALISSQLNDRIYTPFLGTYSVAAHHLANRRKVTDISVAFRLASALGTVCLNLPEDALEELRPPSELDFFGDRIVPLREAHDPGLAFLSLTAASPEPEAIDPRNEQDVADWVDRTVRAAGLGTLPELEQALAVEFAHPPAAALPDDREPRLRALLQAGFDNFPHRGLFGRKSPAIPWLVMHGFTVPPLIFGDDSVLTWAPGVPPGGEELGMRGARAFAETKASIEEASGTAASFGARMETFMAACRS